MIMQHAVRSETGHVRAANEDNFVADADLGLFLVCDGMGGHRGGKRASELACEAIGDALADLEPLADRIACSEIAPDPHALRDRIEAAILQAHQQICTEAGGDTALAGMGTTCTLFLVAGPDTGIIGHVGDSRLYALENDQVHQLTEDHSLVNELVKSGAITPDQALIHPQANIIMRALGTTPDPVVSIDVTPVHCGRTFLLCSDGLYRYFPKKEDFLTDLENPDLQAGVDSMVEKALDNGGRDNITCLVFRMKGT